MSKLIAFVPWILSGQRNVQSVKADCLCALGYIRTMSIVTDVYNIPCSMELV